jgi:hypothetical protein
MAGQVKTTIDAQIVILEVYILVNKANMGPLGILPI